MKFETDESTGLPNLPEGHFFRIGRASRRTKYYTPTMFKMEIRRSTWFGSRVVEKETGYETSEFLIGLISERLAARLYETMAENESEKVRLSRDKENKKKFFGDYPPKKMEKTDEDSYS